MNDASLPLRADRIRFWKYSASANDFILLDNRDDSWSGTASELAIRMCARRYSVGADGLILVGHSEHADVRVRYFNPDGKEFQTCGNGGRCAARFSSQLLLQKSRVSMETNAGLVEAEVTGESVRIQFVPPAEIRIDLAVEVSGRTYRGHFVQLGDPHFVVPYEDVAKMDFVTLARKIRHHSMFAPDGTNVHFVEMLSRRSLRIRSFERGVEDETLACGSGCVSAAVSTFTSGVTEPPVSFLPRSGIPVTVHFQVGGKLRDLVLEGDARRIYAGELSGEALTGFPLPCGDE